jgi:hypothetical protein
MNSLQNKQSVVDIVEKTQFSLDGDLIEHYSDTNELEFRTRENGNVGDETPGYEDIEAAYNLQRELMDLETVSEVNIEEVDEWVHINVILF